MARTVEEGHFYRRRAAPPTIVGGYFKQVPMQQSQALLQIHSGSDCPHKILFKIGLNSTGYETIIFDNEGQSLLLICIHYFRTTGCFLECTNKTAFTALIWHLLCKQQKRLYKTNLTTTELVLSSPSWSSCHVL